MVKSEAVLAQDVQADPQWVRLGDRLRRLRRVKGLTMEEVAATVDLSQSFLSRLERGQTDISVSRLTRLATFYGVRPGDLFVEQGLGETPQIVRPEDGLLIDRGPGLIYRLLTPGQLGGQVTHVVMQPQRGYRDVISHKGHDFVWVLKGQVVLVFGDEEYLVRRGQMIFFEASTPHAFRNDSDRPTEFLGFTTPSYW